jgi:hypothetical protein
MQEPLLRGSDPQTAIAISEQGCGRELTPRAWKRIRLVFPVDKLSDSIARRNQEGAVVALNQAVHQVLCWVEFRRTRLPTPEPGESSYPEIALAVLKQPSSSAAETAVLPVACRPATLNRTEPPSRSCRSAGPNRPFAILKERVNILSRKLLVVSQLAIFPTGEPLSCANPETPIARYEKASNISAGQTVT